MPVLRCVDPECGHEWSISSSLGEGADCEMCGGEAEVVDTYHDDELQPTAVTADRAKVQAGSGPRTAFARRSARHLLAKHRITSVPVPVRALARREGFEIVERQTLGALRARLVGSTIEVVAGDSETVTRFSIAHELGHHVMNTVHGSDAKIEAEAEAFAGELLVPGPQLHLALEETTSVRALANTFQVSLTALRIAAEVHKTGGALTS